MGFRRSKMKHPWFNCTRCSKKTNINDITIQSGARVCNRETCRDQIILGERDAAIAKALNSTSNQKEMQPDGFLSEPQLPIDQEIFF